MITKDIERGKRVARQIETGMVFINQPTWTAPGLSFGGVKNSGYGRELSELGIGAFVNSTHGSRPQPSSMRKTHRVDVDNDTPLLWVLPESRGLSTNPSRVQQRRERWRLSCLRVLCMA